LDILRGEAAHQLLQSGRPGVPEPYPGKEYLAVRVAVQCMQIDDRSHSFGITEMFVTGSSLNVCEDQIDDYPAPEFFYHDFFTAEKLDGWIDLVIPQDERSLILVFSLGNSADGESRYIALEEGASLSIPPELAAIQPTDVGADQANPAPYGALTVSDDWELQILETLRGEAAWQARVQANPRVEAPKEGMEYLIASVRLRYISSREGKVYLSSHNFWAQNSSGDQYGSVFLNLPSTPDRTWLKNNFYPGIEAEGWIVMQAAAGGTGTTIIFLPDGYRGSKTNIRYLQAQP
jgi:hypothetical protein